MKLEKFITNIWKGEFKIANDIIEKFDSWCDFEKSLDPLGRNESTTSNGWQFSFSENDRSPDWLSILMPEFNKIKKEIGIVNLKSSWAIDYYPGGFQDPHVHQPYSNLITVIMNLRGEGELLIFDPRPMAVGYGEPIVEKEILRPGQWFAMPGWLIHNSRPCQERRSILVFDGFIS
jgi:hypothetical protein